VAQQQHSSHEQLGHSLADLLSLQSAGKHPQSAHITLINSNIGLDLLLYLILN
jgi:hypothetical protein